MKLDVWKLIKYLTKAYSTSSSITICLPNNNSFGKKKVPQPLEENLEPYILSNDGQLTKDKSFTLEEIWKPMTKFVTHLKL